MAPKGEDFAAGGRVPELDCPSKLAVAIRRPSGLKAIPTTSAVWPTSVRSTRPVAVSRTWTELFAYALLRVSIGPPPAPPQTLAMSLPSGLGDGPRRDKSWERGRREVFVPELAGVDPGQRRVLFPGARVPALRGFTRDLISGRNGDDTTPVAAIPHAAHPAGVTLEDNRGACPAAPDLQSALQSARGQLAAIGGEGDGLHEVGVTVEHADRAAGGDLPEPDAPVFTRRGEGTAVGLKARSLTNPS